jgi:hypothetical protein
MKLRASYWIGSSEIPSLNSLGGNDELHRNTQSGR